MKLTETEIKKYNSAFKTYDIRGIYNKEIDEILCYNLGRWIGKYMLEHFWKEGTLLFGADVRIANNKLIDAFLNGLEHVGFDNYFCPWKAGKSLEGETYHYGITSTSILYYLTYKNFDIGISFTASHNPAEYAGIKVIDRQCTIFNTTVLKNLIKDRENPTITTTDREKVRKKSTQPKQTSKKNIQEKITAYYNKRLEHFIQRYQSITKPFHIVVDFSSGAWCSYEKEILHTIQNHIKTIHFTYINDQADSNFSAHESNTSAEENFQQLSEKVREEEADLWIMFDGDVDRIGIVDNKGIYHASDLLVALISDHILQKNPWKPVIVDAMSSKTIDTIAKKHKTRCIRSKIGYKFVKKQMIDNQWCLWGEISGHILFPETGGFENPILALYYILTIIEEKKSTLHEIMTKLHPHYRPWMKNIHVKNPDSILKTIEAVYKNKNYTIDKLDGVKIIADTWRCIIRKSNTEPIIRISMEADTKEIREQEMNNLQHHLPS